LTNLINLTNLLIFFSFSASATADVVSLCKNGLNKPILDHQTTLDTIAVNLPPNSRILDVNIRIDTVLHSYDSDLRFYLRHLGTGIAFIRNVGQGGDNFIFTHINDSASCPIGSSSCNLAPFSGIYRPTLPAMLTAFNNQPANGLWILAVSDTFPKDQGVLKSWCLTIVYDALLPAENNEHRVPEKFVLYQNYPNPFNPTTRIRFDIPVASVPRTDTRLIVYDIVGSEVAVLVNNEIASGTYEIEWDASDFPCGVYFYTLTAGDFKQTRKLILLK
jgi:subtilisin-like proprotein convertase family protein